MIFNSLDFAIFLPIVFILYWFVANKSLKIQNALLLVSSYIFYGWWDWRFLGLIIFSSLLDYTIGRKLANENKDKSRKILLFLSVFVNIGFLAVFKYFNFFIDSFTEVFTFFGSSFSASRLNIILPVGISFYTFQTLSYTIDVYKRKLEPSKDLLAFLAFVSFFPQLVAGPIERATNLLPQFTKKRTFSETSASDGLRQILWGLFKKIVVADNCATVVNDIFSNYSELSGSVLVLGAVLFAFQIYGDFSGYSDIAIGTSRLFGFDLMQNFSFPYFSRDIGEFWRRWHISLSTWFRDYLYIPLGGSRGSLSNKIRNVFIIFIVSGFWHGANWTFVFWGALNAVYFLPSLLLNTNRSNLNTVAQGRRLPSLREVFQILFTFTLTCLAWVFFRSPTITDSFSYLVHIFSKSLLAMPPGKVLKPLIYVLIVVVVEWVARTRNHGLEFSEAKFRSRGLRWLIYGVIILIILMFGSVSQEFIYFQF